jgi:prolyl-tRNA synthetase
MRRSSYFIHTLYEVPKEAETPSHILLLRGSFMAPVAAGLYSLLPLGLRSAQKIRRIIKEEMDGIGCHEVMMPVLNPAELWKRTHRYFDIGDELFRIRDRKQREFVLAMTHEEVVTDIAKQFMRSYRDLPVALYQIHTKIRDEARPRAGLLRVREFTMKDAYSFHTGFDSLDEFYPRIYNAYLRVFARCGLDAVPIEADPGMMGGTGSHEFMLESPSGEDRFVSCDKCGYRANTEMAAGKKPKHDDLPDSSPPMERVETPGVTTIAKLMDFFGASHDRLLKTVAYSADGEVVLAVIRGDFDISENKLAKVVRATRLEMAPEEMLVEKGLQGGFLSPVGLEGVKIVYDESINDRTTFIAGGNEIDVHIKNTVPGRDFTIPETHDLTEIRDGDGCLQCGDGTLHIHRGVELGHTFKLGTKYTAPDTMDVTYLDAEGKTGRIVMGCYGIGLERLMASVVERWHDDGGIVWPVTVAPFQIQMVSVGQKPEVLEAAERLHDRLQARFEVLYDDRNESAGVKFKDSDLLGLPIRLVVSQKLLAKNEVEIKLRKSGDVTTCAMDNLEAELDRLIAELTPSTQGLEYLPE